MKLEAMAHEFVTLDIDEDGAVIRSRPARRLMQVIDLARSTRLLYVGPAVGEQARRELVYRCVTSQPEGDLRAANALVLGVA